jgi:DNA invertase Pin-like site-specific DNA recombinase
MIDTTTPQGEMLFGFFGLMAQYERRLAEASMAKPGTTIGELARELGVSRQTLYRHVAPDGQLRPLGQKLLAKRNGVTLKATGTVG